jgi:maleylpyruvate isomerase
VTTEQSSDRPDLPEIRRDVDSCAASHAALTAHLRSLDQVDPTQPSVLPGWTVGHVLTHIARNADGHVSMLAGQAQYPHGIDGRNADIEAGALRSWAELVDDVAASSAAIDARFCDAGIDWTGTAITLGGDRPMAMLPLLRQREVEVHRADLGLDYGFADMPSDYVRKDLRLMGMLWKARKPMGMTPLPEAALALPPAIRLGWMMGRIDVDGLSPANLF